MRFLFPIVLALCILSCRRYGLPVNAVNRSDTAGGSFTAVINGKSWVAMDSARSATIMNGFINLSGLSSDGQNIVISLAGVTPGTYAVGPTLPSLVSWTNSMMFLQSFSTVQGGAGQSGGQVVVTGIDQIHQTISGTFHCAVYSDSARHANSIADGVFINLPYITSYPPSPATDTFTVKMNGLPWSAPSITGTIVEGEFLVQGSTLDGRTVLDLEVPVPAGMGPDIENYRLGIGLNLLGVYSVQFVRNDSVYISQTILKNVGGIIGYQDNAGYLQIVQNDLVNRRLSARFGAWLNDSTGTWNINLTNGYFSLQY
jgi:hypothetical protein